MECIKIAMVNTMSSNHKTRVTSSLDALIRHLLASYHQRTVNKTQESKMKIILMLAAETTMLEYSNSIAVTTMCK